MEQSLEFCNNLKPFLLETINNDIGLLSSDGIKISDPSTGRPSIEYCSPSSPNCEVADRFRLKIPYAGKYISWEFIFNSLSPESPPDINFFDDYFMNFIDVEYLEKHVPSLHSWKYDDMESLKNVLTELLLLYKKYQCTQLKEENNCWVEYVSLLKTGLVNEKDIEVLVTNNGLAYFLIRIYPDLIDYKVPRSDESIEQYAVYVSVSFNNNKMSQPQVSFSPMLKDCFVGKVPTIHEDPHLANYLQRLNCKIEDSISLSLLKPVSKRKKFIFEWLNQLGDKVIEFDAIEFSRVVFLIDFDNFSFILSIELPTDFTASPPEYKLQSIYSSILSTPVVGMPYNPNWPFKVMINKAFNFIEGKIMNFKKLCFENL